MILQDEGYEVECARTGAGALARIESAEVCDLSLVLLDLGLPDMHGTAVLDRIAATRPTLPVVVCSGGRAERRDHAAGILAKPYQFDELLAIVRACTAPR
jgi:two-component system KDP operon response regulator KdpE